MRWTACMIFGLLFCAARVSLAEEHQQQQQEKIGSILDCLFESKSLACVRKRMAQEIDKIEIDITGKSSQMPMSKVIEEGGSFLADGLRALIGLEDKEAGTQDDVNLDGSEVEESRKKKFGKKKKKHLQKLLIVAMLIKSKISLLLQLLSTHFQVKFFVIAILSLLMNAARFWLDLKKSHRPSKVIYYEHAQHQHHYDHDDDHGIWGRSSDEAPQELAYNAYVPEH